MQAIRQQFEGITQAQFQNLCEAVRVKTGVLITGNAGVAQDEKKKWKISYTFFPETGDLEITALDAPFPEELAPHTIADHIKQLVNQVLEA